VSFCSAANAIDAGGATGYDYGGWSSDIRPMAIPHHVRRKLQETLGAEAAEALVSWMEDTDAHRGDVAEVRHEMQISFAKLEQRLDQRFSAIDQRFAHMETLIEKRFAELMKWSFVFWVGAVGAIAALAGMLR